MHRPDRLSALDASFLHLEAGGAHMHVGSCLVFEGEAPSYPDLVALIESRLHLVPRYRQKLAHVPFGQGRPVWVDDPHFNAGYHVRHTALPDPAGDEQLRALAARVFSQQLDRSKPLWELWLVERVGDDRFAVIAKTHHALVDGISGVDVVSVLLDASPAAAPPPAPERPWVPRPEPTPAELLAGAMAERAAEPVQLARTLASAARDVRRAAASLTGVASALLSGVVDPAPPSPLNAAIGPHRRFTWVDADLAAVKAMKNALGGTVNDVVLTAVAGALREWYRRHGHRTEGVTLKALVPVSVRADAERGALGNRVSAVSAPLPIGEADPLERFRTVHAAMGALKASGQAVGAELISRLTGFAPPTVLSQAARLQAGQRVFNLTVTNIPGPQHPLYLGGRRLAAIYPMVPLAPNARLGIAVLSYDGALGFGLLTDYDALPDVGVVAGALCGALDELAAASGAGNARNGAARRARRRAPA